MFETSVVTARAQRKLPLFTISLLAHTAVIVGVIGVSIASVDFPTNAPRESAFAPVFRPLVIPPPLGNPNGGARAQAPPQRPAAVPPAPAQITAPREVPDEVPVLESASTDIGQAAGQGTGTVPGPVGQPWGVADGLGELDAPPGPVAAEPQQIYVVGGEVKAPLLIRRVDPPYPEVLRRTRMQAIVVVRCVIDRNGNVRDPQIVKAAMPPFNAAVIEAVQQWRFRPGSLRGEAVETYLDLTVRFSVN